MSPEMEAKLLKEFPKLLTGLHHVATGDGWFPIIWSSLRKMERYCKEHECDVTVPVIKEKFGLLRLGFDITGNGIDYNAINDMANEAEMASGGTCEECGAPGRIRTKGWLQTLCDVHEKRAEREP